MSTRALTSATLANLLIPLSGLLVGPLLSRELGPEGRGLYAALTLPVVVCGWLGTVGLQDALAYHVRGDRLSRRAAGLVGLVAAVPLGLAGTALLAAVGWFVFAGEGDYDQFLVLALFAPVHILANLLLGALTGGSDIRGVNLVKVVPAVLRTAVVVVACLAFDLSAFWAGLLFLASMAAGVALGLTRLLRARPTAGPTGDVPVRSLLRYALSCLPGVLAGVAGARLDQVVGLPLIGARELGYYAVAVSVAELPMAVAVAARTVLMGRASTGDPRTAARPARLAVVGSMAASALLAAAAPFAVPWVFGAAFAPAVLPTVILCGGTVLYTGVLILGAVLLADGRPGRSSGALVIGTVTGVVVLVMLAPLGAVGAAVAGLVGYGVSLAVMAWALARVRNGTGWTLRMVTVPYGDDVAAARDRALGLPALARFAVLARRVDWGTLGAVVLLTLAWLRTVAPATVQMVTAGRPVFNARETTVDPTADLLGDAISLAFIAVAAVLVVLGVVARHRPRRWPLLAVVLAPPAAIAVAGLVNGQLPDVVTLALPLAAVAVWVCPPDVRVLTSIGVLGAASAAGSMLMAVLRPDLALLTGSAEGGKDVLLGGLLAGPYPHANVLGIILALSLPFVFCAGPVAARGAMLALVLPAVLWTGSRTAQLAVVAVLLGQLLLWSARRLGRDGARLLSVPVAAGLALLVLVPPLTHDPDAFTRRGRIWQALLDRWADRPLLGWGPDVFARPEVADALGGQFTHGHNVMVHLLVVGGLAAAGCFAGLIALAWRGSLTLARSGRSAPMLFLVALTVVSLFEASHVSTTLAGCPTWLPLALIVRLATLRPAASPSGPVPRSAPGQKITVSRR